MHRVGPQLFRMVCRLPAALGLRGLPGLKRDLLNLRPTKKNGRHRGRRRERSGLVCVRCAPAEDCSSCSGQCPESSAEGTPGVLRDRTPRFRCTLHSFSMIYWGFHSDPLGIKLLHQKHILSNSLIITYDKFYDARYLPILLRSLSHTSTLSF